MIIAPPRCVRCLCLFLCLCLVLTQRARMQVLRVCTIQRQCSGSTRAVAAAG